MRAATGISEPDRDLWVFGYGSLMWRPGFDFVERQLAWLRGYHRALCIYSHVHRGTPERPGLVLGLDRGGSCRGVAFRVEAQRAAATIAYLRTAKECYVTASDGNAYAAALKAAFPDRSQPGWVDFSGLVLFSTPRRSSPHLEPGHQGRQNHD